MNAELEKLDDENEVQKLRAANRELRKRLGSLSNDIGRQLAKLGALVPDENPSPLAKRLEEANRRRRVEDRSSATALLNG
jgi:hypothetical protein